jgi:hypothetical protein
MAFRRGTDARSIPRIRVPGEHKRDRSVLVGKLAEILREAVRGGCDEETWRVHGQSVAAMAGVAAMVSGLPDGRSNLTVRRRLSLDGWHPAVPAFELAWQHNRPYLQINTALYRRSSHVQSGR